MPFTFKLSKRLSLMKASLAPAAAAALAACELPSTQVTDPTPPSNPVVQVVTSPETVTLDPRQTRQFVAYGRTPAGDSVAVRVTWSSTNTAVATVSSSGLVTGVAPGMATVTASSEGQSGTSDITVANLPVASVTVSPASASLLVGATRQFSAVTKDAAGNTLSGRLVTWSSSNMAVATVGSSGLATGLVPGAVTITATSEGVRGTAALTIAGGVSNHIGSPDLEPGLLGRTDLVLFEDFEFADWLTHWSGGYVVDPATLSRVTSPTFQGSQGLQIRVPNGSHYGAEVDFAFAKKGLAEPDQIYLRYYVRFNDTWQKSGDGEIGKLPGFGGTYGRCGWSSGSVDGTCWSARMMNWDTGTTNQIGFYVYHMDGDGEYGSPFRWQPALNRGQWYCVEANVKLNSLSGGTANYDGVLRGWIDGAPAFERTNLRFRNVSSTHIEKIWWNIYVGGQWTADRDMAIHFDNVVIAHQRIGCQ
jgi:hypothetical protein